MNGIPYNRLQTVEFTAKTDNGETVVVGTSHYTFVVPCRDCRYYDERESSEVYPHRHWCDKLTVYMPPNGFCSWGE